jgi:hypothetical protein
MTRKIDGKIGAKIARQMTHAARKTRAQKTRGQNTPMQTKQLEKNNSGYQDSNPGTHKPLFPTQANRTIVVS